MTSPEHTYPPAVPPAFPLPDAAYPAPGAPASGQILATRCGGCGSQVDYSPGSSQLQCGACGFRTEIAHGVGESIEEHSFDGWLATNPQPAVTSFGGLVLTCQGCDAITESTALSGACQFCGGNLVAVTNPDGFIEPEAVLPFAVDGARARAAFATWVKSRWFAPGALKAVGDTESLRGTYVPHWTFDAASTSQYSGQRGDHYTVKVNDRQERRTRWRSESGTVARSFDDVLVPASTSVPAAQLDKLGPWHLERAVPYRPDYLAGHSTLRYDVEPVTGAEAARAQMASVIRSDVKHAIGGDEQRISHVSTAYAEVMFKLVLLPMWIATYMYAGKQLQVMVNAITGEVVGQRPYSPAKIALAVLGALLVIVGLIVVWQMRT